MMILVLGLLWATPGEGTVYKFDPEHRFVSFTIRHFSVGTMRVRFNDIKGHVRFDEQSKRIQELVIEIDPASIDTGNSELDEGLKSNFWLDVQKFPKIGFQSSKFEYNDGGFVVTGQFTMKGETREISFPVHMQGPVDDPLKFSRIGLVANLKILRQDYAMPFDRKMKDGGPLVGNQLHVEVLIEAITK